MSIILAPRPVAAVWAVRVAGRLPHAILLVARRASANRRLPGELSDAILVCTKPDQVVLMPVVM